jgi:hypothetical protein
MILNQNITSLIPLVYLQFLNLSFRYLLKSIFNHHQSLLVFIILNYLIRI